MKMSATWEDDGYLDIKELEDQIVEFVDKSELEEMLRIQLEEVEMLKSMFSNPGEFEIYDHSVITDINDFVEGKCKVLPPRFDFTVNLALDEKKLEVCVNLPLNYPADEPDIFVRNDSLSRTQQHALNGDLAKYIASLNKGEICIYPAVAWLQENALSYFISQVKSHKSSITTKITDSNKQFSRYWIYSHHIYSKIKRRCIMDLAQEYNVTGFCLPGRPGIICVEGWGLDCHEWWQRIRCMNWKKIVCKKKEEEQIKKEATMESLRKFTGFEEISFDGGKNKMRESHMDMGEFYKYLSDHECGYVFREYFGVDGKVGAPVQ
uniref:RWD domain-containing protein n=1 Tax=Graphocephala atropunctata TaxID=36148 RepID=A0A1B6MR14_9HEMI